LEYEQIVKERQRLSAIRTNSLKSNSQKSEAIEKARQKRSDNIKEKISKALAQCEKDNIKPRIVVIAKMAGVDRGVVGKILKSPSD
jgi:hypothetical protein